MPDTYHGGIRWTEYLMSTSGGSLGPAEYTEVAELGLFHGLGDWVFAGALYDDDFGRARLADYAHRRRISVELVTAMRAHAASFLEQAVTDILRTGPQIVGFSTTFMQNVSSLAAARMIRRRSPDTRILFGGGNCDGPMGAALQRNHPWIDFVLSGEAEETLPQLLTALDDGTELREVPGLSWWDGSVQRHNRPARPLGPQRFPRPDYDDWFAVIDSSPVREYIEPKLVLESARGCWWGEVHQCTFCGLNGTGMSFRAKPATDVLAEITELTARHQVLDLIMVDNIIDNRYYVELLPALAELDCDLRVHYEVKSNLRECDVAALRRAGVVHVQPGVESLVSPVLKLMDKGVTATRNVRSLRDLESAGLTVTWNWLYGFPGELAAQYDHVLAQLPALVHLQPPSGVARILLERFSPYFDDPALGFPDRTAAALYRHVYDLTEEQLRDMVYLYDSPPQGLSDHKAQRLHEALDSWSAGYPASSLIRFSGPEGIVIHDRRAGWPRADYVIDRPDRVVAYRELEHGRSARALASKLTEHGHRVADADLTGWLDDLRDRGLIFAENGQLVALATTAAPVKVI